MRTFLLYAALGLLGMAPVWLVLSVWEGDDPPAPAAPLSAEEQERRNREAQHFVMNRDGCELALNHVQQVLSRTKRGNIALESCQVDTAQSPDEHVAHGRVKYLGANQWDPPVAFSLWLIPVERGRLAACALQLGRQARKRVRSPHRSCPDWGRRG